MHVEASFQTQGFCAFRCICMPSVHDLSKQQLQTFDSAGKQVARSLLTVSLTAAGLLLVAAHLACIQVYGALAQRSGPAHLKQLCAACHSALHRVTCKASPLCCMQAGSRSDPKSLRLNACFDSGLWGARTAQWTCAR